MPLGVIIFGRINCFILGALFFLFFLAAIFKVTPQNLEEALESLKLKSGGIDQAINFKQFRFSLFVHMFVSLMFFISGEGILRRKEWGRKLTLALSSGIVFLVFISVLFQPFLVQQAVIFIIYPAALILYFTNKNIEKYFYPSKGKDDNTEEAR